MLNGGLGKFTAEVIPMTPKLCRESGDATRITICTHRPGAGHGSLNLDHVGKDGDFDTRGRAVEVQNLLGGLGEEGCESIERVRFGSGIR